jgi:uncharacterized protein YdcH (DUF465 family)
MGHEGHSKRRIGMTPSPEQVEQASPTFDELQTQHQDHERRLEELKKKSWLSPEEEMEEKRLKKLKLYLKDQMERLRQAAS